MSESVIVEKSGKAAIIKFNRPEIKNPLSVATLENLERIFSALSSDAAIEKIIFTGSGDTFASGANLKEVAGLTRDSAREFGLRGQNLMRKIYNSEKLNVAAIDGFCMGGALDLALSCGLRIASSRSVFAHPGASLGIITGWSGTQILPRLVGKKKAFEMFLTAKKVSASEALEIGLINQISETVVETALEIQMSEARR
ncbi:MAG TPA: enoyl-CoA hydratase/isomerase family protein [Pyrinomonadaceae bacterium]|jgi:enoyl-CoA hydratase